MKQNKKDIVILMVVIGIIISVIGFANLMREIRNSPVSSYDNMEAGSGLYNEVPNGQEKTEKALTPTKVRLIIDVIMGGGLLAGLSLILRKKTNYMLIIVLVGIIIVLIDLYLRRLFG
ncbi:hypothetical protein [Phosphitispora sp. TUW77]|uniref:hypothetical protein n=1 Tax=Phosphitispora sp. TUW77 TaxID=3152361 RepID=UPI003AB53190